MISWCLSKAINTRDSTDTLTETHWMNGTRRHNSEPNTQWSMIVYMTVKGRQKTHTRMSENDRLQMKMLVTLTFSLRRAMMQMRPMLPTNPSTIVTLYQATRHAVRTGDMWHCSSCSRMAKSERSWVSFPGQSCTDPWLARSFSQAEDCGGVELLKIKGKGDADKEDWVVLPLKDISPRLKCHQHHGSNCPSQPSENMHLKQREKSQIHEMHLFYCSYTIEVN